MTRQETDAHVIMPDKSVFDDKRHVIESVLIQQGMKYHIYLRTEYPEDGGIYVYYKGLPYPKKGFPYPEAVWANDVIKRITLTIFKSVVMKETIPAMLVVAILPWKIKIKIVENFLHNYARISDWLFHQHFLKLNRYSNACRILHIATDTFLFELGITGKKQLHGDYLSKYIALTVATIIEYDDAYRYRFEDIITETTREKLIANPFTEVRRLLDIFEKRETYDNVKGHIRMMRIAISLALLHPRVRKAFKYTLKQLTDEQFNKMKLDNADRYHVLLRGDYNFTGLDFGQRCKIYEEFHKSKNIPFPPEVEVASYKQ
jgi:hypothetical protein